MTSLRSSVPVLFVVWSRRDGRAQEMAHALGGNAVAIYPTSLSSRWLTPLRYLASAVLTLIALLRTRPRSVMVTNPPVFAGLVVALYCAVVRIPFALDSHPTAFGAKNNRVAQRLLPLTTWLTKRASITLVTTPSWVDVVQRWGGRGLVFHEAPPLWTIDRPRSLGAGERPHILYVGIFGGDEPVEVVLQAAALVPQYDIFITGDLRRSPAGLVEQAPANVHFTGYLETPAFVAAMTDAHVVCALTTEPTSVMRAAYEAVYGHRPLVISDTTALRPLFPHAVFVENQATALAQGWNQAISTYDDLSAAANQSAELQAQRWNDQRVALTVALGLLSSAQ